MKTLAPGLCRKRPGLAKNSLALFFQLLFDCMRSLACVTKRQRKRGQTTPRQSRFRSLDCRYLSTRGLARNWLAPLFIVLHRRDVELEAGPFNRQSSTAVCVSSLFQNRLFGRQNRTRSVSSSTKNCPDLSVGLYFTRRAMLPSAD